MIFDFSKWDKEDWIFLIGFILFATLMIAFALSFFEVVESGAKIRCSSHFSDKAMESYNFLQVCNSQECVDFFTNQFKFYINASGECLK
jgi:hypothetical protein